MIRHSFTLPALASFILSLTLSAQSPEVMARLAGGQTVALFRTGSGEWGIVVEQAGTAMLRQAQPITLEFYDDGWPAPARRSGYRTFRKTAVGFDASAKIPLKNGAAISVEDHWTASGAVLAVSRELTVSGAASGGFLSAVTLTTAAEFTRDRLEFFAPGMIYGGTAHLTPTAIGGSDTYRHGRGVIRIREDRLPAPVFGIRFPNGRGVAVLDAHPDGRTTARDSRDLDIASMVDERFRFGAIGVEPEGGKLTCGYWFPGAEGEVTYRGRMYPGGQVHGWRGRYHPVRDGLTQHYEVAFRFTQPASFPDFYRDTWRWAWRTLNPAVAPQDIEKARRALTDMLTEQTASAPDGKIGLVQAITATPGEPQRRSEKATMGFTGKSLEAAEFLLYEAGRDKTARGESLRRRAESIFDSFIRIKMAPPAGEGFLFATGAAVPARYPRETVMYLRSFGDDMKATLRAIKRERAQGREHPKWLAWVKDFAGWLLPQQCADGSFPRTWHPGTGEVADRSPQSSYNPIPFLILLSDLTGDAQYRTAALRAAEYVWSAGQRRGLFVGGTIDNPDVIDKEAGTLSLEAYLAAYDATREKNWLDRAAAAADFAETWIYCWNIPMPEGENDAELHWKKGVPTTGLQLIATGHSLTDEYMAFDVDEYAKVSVHTADPHYLDVARILLHNTKVMLAVEGRAYDLKGPGWQQEHWSLAPMRGYGIHRLWLPWVTTSHLNGIIGLEEFDPALFARLCATGAILKR